MTDALDAITQCLARALTHIDAATVELRSSQAEVWALTARAHLDAAGAGEPEPDAEPDA